MQKPRNCVFRDRIVACPKTNLESSNWRHDFARFANISYADMAKRKAVNIDSKSDGKKVTYSKIITHSRCAGFKNNNRVSHMFGKTDNISSKRKTCFVKSAVNARQNITLKNRFEALSCSDNDQSCNGETSLDDIAQSDRFESVSSKNENTNEKQPKLAQVIVKKQCHSNQKQKKALQNGVTNSNGNSDVPGNSVPKNGSFAKVFDVKESMSLYDKYTLELHLKEKHKDVLAFAKGNKNFDAWNAQVMGKFGYIPLANHKIPDCDKNVVFDGNSIEMHERVWNSKEHNFMGEQIIVPSQFNIDVWEKELQGYWDKQLLFLLKYGFPLDFDYTNPLKSTLVNHSSANQHVDDVKYYVQTEKSMVHCWDLLSIPL